MNPEYGHEPEMSAIRISEGRELLQRKLEEYKTRLDKIKTPEAQTDTIYKIAIAERLLSDGEVKYNEIYQELQNTYGNVDEVDFKNAYLVIEDYVKTGGKSNRGGTGLDGEKGQNHGNR